MGICWVLLVNSAAGFCLENIIYLLGKDYLCILVFTGFLWVVLIACFCRFSLKEIHFFAGFCVILLAYSAAGFCLEKP